jgi:hypothetical protein
MSNKALSIFVFPFAKNIYPNVTGTDTSGRPLLIMGIRSTTNPIVTVCGPGEFGAGGRSPCSPCVKGSFSSQVGDSTCQSLYPVGTYSGTAGAKTTSTFMSCQVRKYTNSSGMSTCSNCNQGTYNPSIGASSTNSCILCSVGRTTSTSAAYQISQCVAYTMGRYAMNIGSTICASCTPGRFNNQTAAPHFSACLPCAAETASSIPAASVCSACLPGTYGAQDMMLQCSMCPEETYQNAGAQSMCVACSAGRSRNVATRRRRNVTL